MDVLSAEKQKEQQRINELELKIKREKAKLDKKLTKQKILLGAYFIELLESNKVENLRSFTAENLEGFLTRKGDKELMSDIIKSLQDQAQTNSSEYDYENRN